MSRTAALLSRLALPAGRYHRRAALAEELWPDANEVTSRHRLRQALVELRRVLGSSDALLTDRDTVCLEADRLETDVASFLYAVSAAEQARGAQGSNLRLARLSDAVDLYAGDLLPAFTDSWIEEERYRLRLCFLGTLKSLATCAEAAEDYLRAVAGARRLTAEEPSDEDTALLLVRLLTATGQVDAARREYERFRKSARRADLKPTAEYRRRVGELIRRAVPSTGAVVVTGSMPDPAPIATRLPLFLTRFFGREPEIARIHALLVDPHVRLVTLVGPGGLGKTRLSLETVAKIEVSACFVGLAAVPADSDVAAVAAQIGAALGLSIMGEKDAKALDSVVNALRVRGASILILDNLEHLLAFGTLQAVALRLLREAPQLTLLATSRLPLGIEGEIILPLSTLPVGDGRSNNAIDIALSPEHLSESLSGIALFVDRMRSVRPDFELTTANVRTVKSLCRRLDGLPLALELAAGWGRTHTPEQMIERLDRRFTFLVRRDGRSSGIQTSPAMGADGAPSDRHRSLAAVVAWSYDMLPHETAAFFRRLAVFQGGCTAAAAAAVAGEGSAAFADHHLEILCEHSLIVAEPVAEPVVGTAMRFNLLETLRDFAAEQLTPDERMDAERKHLAYHVRLAADGAIGLKGPDQWSWLDTLRAERPNFRAAFTRKAVTREDDAARAQLAAHLNEFFWIYETAVGFEWTEMALDVPDLPVHLRGRLLTWRGRFAICFSDRAGCDMAHAEAAKLFREIGDLDCLLDTLARWRGNPEAIREAVDLGYRLGRKWEIAYARLYEARRAVSAAEARRLFAESQSLFNECQDQMSIRLVRRVEAASRADRGEIADAVTTLEDLIRLDAINNGCGAWRPTSATYKSRHLLADLRRLQGDFDSSYKLSLQAERLARSLDWSGLLSDALLNRSLVHLDTYELEAARVCIQERANLLANYPGSGRHAVVINSLLSKLYVMEGDYDRASLCAAIVVREVVDVPHYGWQVRARIVLGQAALGSGDFHTAASTFHAAIKSALDIGNRVITAEAVEATSHAAAALGRCADAAFLLAFAAAEREAMGIILPPQLRPDHDAAFAAIRVSLSPRSFTSATQRGYRATIDTVSRFLDRTIPIPA